VSAESLRSVLAEGDRLLLDTSVVAAFFDTRDANHGLASHLLEELVAPGRNPAVVSMVVVMELLVRPMRTVPQGHHTVLGFLRTFPNIDCLSVDLQVAQEAAHLRAASRFSTPDALIVGTGLAAQVRHLVTNDRDWVPRLAPMRERIGVVLASDHLPFPART